MTRSNPRAPWLALAALAAFAVSCTTVQTVEQYQGAQLPRPDRILVYDFAYSPSQVRLDRGISADLARSIQGQPRSLDELEVGQKVANVLAEQLVKEIREMGLPAQRAAGRQVGLYCQSLFATIEGDERG